MTNKCTSLLFEYLQHLSYYIPAEHICEAHKDHSDYKFWCDAKVRRRKNLLEQIDKLRKADCL